MTLHISAIARGVGRRGFELVLSRLTDGVFSRTHEKTD